jgi:hypothetical protein
MIILLVLSVVWAFKKKQVVETTRLSILNYNYLTAGSVLRVSIAGAAGDAGALDGLFF